MWCYGEIKCFVSYKKTRTVTKVPHTPTQCLVTEQVSFYRKKNIMEVSYSPNSGHLERCLVTKYELIPFIPSWNMVIIMTLWISNGAVLKSSSQWQLNELWKLNNSSHVCTNVQKNRQGDSSIPPKFHLWGYKNLFWQFGVNRSSTYTSM